MPRSRLRRINIALGLATAALVAACGEAAPPARLPLAREFVLVAAEPPTGSQLWLNQPIRLTFSDDVDLATVGFDSVRFAVTDASGGAVSEHPRGTFVLRASAEGSPDDRRVLEFVPLIGASRHDGGLRAGRRYTLDLTADGPARLHGTSGERLARSVQLQFTTPDGNASAVYFDPIPGRGPRLRAARATPRRGAFVSLGEPSAAPVAVHLEFDQPLDPDPENLPTSLDPSPARIDPRRADARTKGRVYLEYDDPVFGRDTWIPATVELVRNDNDGGYLVVMPVGVLPNATRVRVIVAASLRDLSGEDNQRDVSYRAVAYEFDTEPAAEPRFAALVEDFATADHIDFDAPLDEPMAEWEPGRLLAAATPFEGDALDYRPREVDLTLNTDVTEVTASGRTFTVTGGVFRFRNVTIPQGTSVRGIGSKPMVWIVEGDMDIAGTLSVDGGPGQAASGFGAYNQQTVHAAYGGSAPCGGGRGGRGSPSDTEHDLQGEAGFGPFQAPAGGGVGGLHGCNITSCIRGGGGGGGSFATAGDAHHVSAMFGALPRVGLGAGGAMCVPMTGPRAAAGQLAFRDARHDNDFFGRGIAVDRRSAISGELLTLRGGSGGGGGGDTGLCSSGSNFRNSWLGGGGGGGGGALLLQVRGRLIVRQSGQIRAEGGRGGGGSQSGTNQNAGGGGGGSGGMVVVMAGAGIHIVAHGAPYAYAEPTSAANGAYDFAISADGGTGRRTPFAGNPISGKYPGQGGSAAAAAWDINPIGGFGGLGLVQLMAPPGDNRPLASGGDGTATRLDDHVFFYRDDRALEVGLRAANPHAPDGGALTGETKARYLGWRGTRDEQGVGRDDDGNVVRLPRDDHGEGDIRPAPILLPSPIGPLSRARSTWRDLGAVVRRVADDGPRQIRELIDPDAPDDPTRSFRAGPSLAFAATHDGVSGPLGYARTRELLGNLVSDAPAILPTPVAVAEVVSGEHEGVPAHVIRLVVAEPRLAQPQGRYVGYRAELATADGLAESYRILAHREDAVVVSADEAAMLTRVTTLQVRAEFFRVARGANVGFGEGWLEGGRKIPASNLRIGFALHVDPTRQRAGNDPRRYPSDSREFLFGIDLARPAVARAVREFVQSHATTRGTLAVQWDVTFNSAYSERRERAVDPGRPLLPRRESLALDLLVLPLQF